MVPTPPRALAGTLPEAHAAVLAALLHGHTTYPELQAATGLGKSSLHHQLHVLRELGWCTWVDGKAGTLRPTLECAWPEYMLEERCPTA